MSCILLLKMTPAQRIRAPKPPSLTPSLTPSEILYVGFLYVLFPFPTIRSGPGKPNQKKSVHELFAGAFRNKSLTCASCLFSLRKNTRIHKNGRNSWTFRFGPFFGLVCRGDSWYKSISWFGKRCPESFPRFAQNFHTVEHFQIPSSPIKSVHMA